MTTRRKSARTASDCASTAHLCFPSIQHTFASPQEKAHVCCGCQDHADSTELDRPGVTRHKGYDQHPCMELHSLRSCMELDSLSLSALHSRAIEIIQMMRFGSPDVMRGIQHWQKKRNCFQGNSLSLRNRCHVYDTSRYVESCESVE
jgi:hypothetical protein